MVFLIVTISSFNIVYTSNHLAGTLFLASYLSISLLEFFLFTAVTSDLPKFLHPFCQEILRLRRFPPSSYVNSLRKNSFCPSLFLAQLLPRQRDIFAKGTFFVYGFIAALAGVGLQKSQLDLVNALFSGPTPWTTTAEVPLSGIMALGAVYFVVEEGIVQQAKLLWDDIRDRDRDRRMPHNRHRALASGLISRSAAIAHVFIRLVLALVLGFLLGGSGLIIAFVVIIVHQFLYMYAKRWGKDLPLLLLSLLSFNVSLRCLVGMMAIVGDAWTYAPNVFLLMVFYWASFGGMAAFWKMEGLYFTPDRLRAEAEASVNDGAQNDGTSGRENKSLGCEELRPQLPYYRRRGNLWQRAGLGLAVAWSGLLLGAYYLTRQCSDVGFLLEEWFAVCSTTTPGTVQARYQLLDAGGTVIAIFISILTPILMIYTVCIFTGGLSRIMGRRTIAVMRPLRGMLPWHGAENRLRVRGLRVSTAVACLAFGSAIVLGLYLHNYLGFLWFICLLNIGYLFNYEGMTYEEYANFFSGKIWGQRLRRACCWLVEFLFGRA